MINNPVECITGAPVDIHKPHQHVFFPSNPWADTSAWPASCSVFLWSIIRSDGNWVSHPSQSHQHAAFSSQRGGDVVTAMFWFISVIHCSLSARCLPALSVCFTSTHTPTPAPTQTQTLTPPPQLSRPHTSRHDGASVCISPDVNHSLGPDLLKLGILQPYGPVIDPGRQPELH